MCTKCGLEPLIRYKNSHNTWCRNCINLYINNRTDKPAKKKYSLNLEWKRGYNKRRYSTYVKPVVYAYFNSEGVCIYVGRGSITRAKNHRYSSSWWNENLLLITLSCDSEWQAMEYEGKWGGRYLPLMNKEGYRYAN